MHFVPWWTGGEACSDADEVSDASDANDVSVELGGVRRGSADRAGSSVGSVGSVGVGGVLSFDAFLSSMAPYSCFFFRVFASEHIVTLVFDGHLCWKIGVLLRVSSFHFYIDSINQRRTLRD